MSKLRHLLLAFPILASHAACSSDDPAAPTTITQGSCSANATPISIDEPEGVRVLSYNAGFALGFVLGARERRGPTSEEMGIVPTDILCAQEVWEPEDQAAVMAQVGDALPNAIWVADDAGDLLPAPCADGELDPLETCVSANCANQCSEDLINCALDNCIAEVGATPSECLQCVQGNFNIGTIDEVKTKCESEGSPFVYDGAYGIGLLTKYPILEQAIVKMDSYTTRRAFIYAKLDTDIGEVHAYCTHLTAIFDDLPHPAPPLTWEEENANQVAELLADIEMRAGADGQVLLMGDLNNGPAGDGYVGEGETAYATIPAAGFRNPYIEDGNPCTVCNTNPLNEDGNDSSDNEIIDHVLTRGIDNTMTSQRVIDGTCSIEVCNEERPVAPSDHYGVRVIIHK